MTDDSNVRLEEILRGWIANLPHDEVVRRYKALASDEQMAVTGYGWEKSAAALNSDEPYGDHMEMLARYFDVFAEGEDAPPLLSSAAVFRERAHELRHPEEWRNAPGPRQLSEGRLKALALASSCWSDEPDYVRLRRIEEVLQQLNKLADEAVAERRFDDEAAIGHDIVGLWRLRDSLRAGS